MLLEVVAMVSDPTAEKLGSFGVQLGLLGVIALFLGALRLLLAKRTRGRLVLAIGALLLAAGFAVETAEYFGVYEQGYYPGWNEEEFHFQEEDGTVIEIPTPSWSEALAWWGARLLRITGFAMAATGFVMDGRWVLRNGGETGARRRA
jgi:hypothetical protein